MISAAALGAVDLIDTFRIPPIYLLSTLWPRPGLVALWLGLPRAREARAEKSLPDEIPQAFREA